MSDFTEKRNYQVQSDGRFRFGPSGAGDLAAQNAPIIMLAGGTSAERAVGLETASQVAEVMANSALGAPTVVEIDPDGAWHVDGEILPPAEAVERLPRDAIFFIGAHGGAEEDGTLQGFLETSNRVYVGSGVAASALCMNKQQALSTFRSAKIQTPRGLRIGQSRWEERSDGVLEEILAISSTGFFVKPNTGGSSLVTTSAATTAELVASIEAVLAAGDDALVEERVCGIEVGCPLVGNRATGICALLPIEVRTNSGNFYDYNEKYGAIQAARLCPPASLPETRWAELQELATRAFRVAGCDGYGRADFIVPVTSDAGFGEPVILELNTLCGITPSASLPTASDTSGVALPDLLGTIGLLALERAAHRAR